VSSIRGPFSSCRLLMPQSFHQRDPDIPPTSTRFLFLRHRRGSRPTPARDHRLVSALRGVVPSSARPSHVQLILYSGQEDTDDSRGRSRPDGAVTPLHLLSSNHSTDHLFPARNGLHTRFSGVPPISGGGSSAAPSSRSADSSRGRLRRTHPGNARPRSLHWDWRDENEEAEDFIRPQRRTKKKPPKRVVREQWFAPGEREAVALRRT
jgi:hypothetical protein